MHATLLEGLIRLDIILSSTTTLFAFSLLAYLFFYNFRSPVARAFVAVLAFITVVAIGDVFLASARFGPEHPAATFWLRLQWLGIALIVPACLHFGDVLLDTTGSVSRRRRWGVGLAVLGGLLALGLAWTGDLLVAEPAGRPGSVHLQPGPLFPAFALAYFGLAALALGFIGRARGRTLTARSHRRMSYLLATALVPLSAFPWLMLGGGGLAGSSPLVFRSLSASASAAVAAALVVIGYGVAYQGALTPERAVKRQLVKFLIQAPLLGLFVVALTTLVPRRLEASLGLPRDLVVILVVVFGIVAFQLLVQGLRPLVDRLVYGRAGRDAMWLRRLDEQLLTSEDLEQLLENILAAMCDRLRVRSGGVVVLVEGQVAADVYVGDREPTAACLASLEPGRMQASGDGTAFVEADGYWVHALRRPPDGLLLGLLAIERPPRAMAAEDLAFFERLLAGAEQALEDSLLQDRVIGALRDLEPELAGLQRLRGTLEPGAGEIHDAGDALVDSPDFPHWVKDALGHYWGGPKLTESPLLRLEVVREAMAANDQNAARAMRAVLDQGLERLKPDGDRSLSASQWMVYNILELRFVRGLRVRDIARRLAMSESDLYRKQRVAIEALAAQLSAMEAGPAVPSEEGREADAPEMARNGVT